MTDYPPDEWLPLSGIQHFLFCRRQWALIYVERQWRDNVLTVEGKYLHSRADDPFFSEVREGVIIARAVPIASHQLGLSGICDVVEFVPSTDGVSLPGRIGRYSPVPIEYKHGKEKTNKCDQAQLCAQAMCLEEMLSVSIPAAYLFYAQTRRRVAVELTIDLRNIVSRASQEMHQYFARGDTPQVKPSRACKSCSLQDICLPSLQRRSMSASKYIQLQISSELQRDEETSEYTLCD
jgi:CRISPR-associated exonuclease Cas4